MATIAKKDILTYLKNSGLEVTVELIKDEDRDFRNEYRVYVGGRCTGCHSCTKDSAEWEGIYEAFYEMSEIVAKTKGMVGKEWLLFR